MVNTVLITKIRKFAADGGQVIISCRTGQKDKNGHLWEAKPSEPIYSLIGAEVLFHDQLLKNSKGLIKFNENNYTWNNWADVLNAYSGTEILAYYTNQFYQGKPAIIRNRIGKGSVTYIGVDSEDGTLEKDVMKKVYTDAGINIENYPAGVSIEFRDGFWIAVNYSSNTYELPTLNNSKFIIGTTKLASPGAAVWIENKIN